MIKYNDPAPVRTIEHAAQPTIRFKKLHPNAQIPAYQTPGAAGMDLHLSEKPCGMDTRDGPLFLCLFGIAVEIPEGYEGQIRPRSSTSKAGWHVYPGTIDSDYRGELMCVIQRLASRWPITGKEWLPGDRIAQLIIAPVSRATITVVDELSDTERGEGGFGSTGR